MRRQNDSSLRVVSLDNLQAMCDRASGMAHTYSATVQGSRCILEYSNPDEYGSAHPYSIALPLLRTDDAENPDVLFHMLSERGRGLCEFDKDACYQSIDSAVLSAPRLIRYPDDDWQTEHEILQVMDRKHESISAGPYEVIKDVDGTYRVNNGHGYIIALAMCKADAELLHRALWDASQKQGIPNVRAKESAT